VIAPCSRLLGKHELSQRESLALQLLAPLFGKREKPGETIGMQRLVQQRQVVMLAEEIRELLDDYRVRIEKIRRGDTEKAHLIPLILDRPAKSMEISG
jgi:hypothetical protein